MYEIEILISRDGRHTDGHIKIGKRTQEAAVQAAARRLVDEGCAESEYEIKVRNFGSACSEVWYVSPK